VVKMKRRLMSRESELPEISEVCPWAGLLRPIFDVITAVAVALDADDLGVVDQPVDEGGRGGRIGKDGEPLAEGQIGREDQAATLVAATHDLKEEIARRGRRRTGSRSRRVMWSST